MEHLLGALWSLLSLLYAGLAFYSQYVGRKTDMRYHMTMIILCLIAAKPI